MGNSPEFKALYEILIERRRTIATFCLIGAVIGFCISMTTPARYQSKGQILVMQKLAKFVGDKGKSFNAMAYERLFATHLQLISSPKIVQQAIDNRQLDRIDSLHSAVDDQNRTVVEVIMDRLKVARAGSGDSDGAFVIELKFRHSNADDAKTVLDAIFEAYQNHFRKSSLDGQEEAVQLITKMEANAAREVDAKAAAYNSFVREAPGIWNRNTLENPHQDRIDHMLKELTNLEIRKVGIESRIKIMKESQDPDRYSLRDRLALIDQSHVNRLTLFVSVINAEMARFPQSTHLQEKEHFNTRYNDLLKLQRQRSIMSQNLGSDHPALQEVDADIKLLAERLDDNKTDAQTQVDELQVDPEKLLHAYECLLANDLANVTQHINSVKESLENEQLEAKELLATSLKGEQLQHEYERSRELYRAMLDLLREQNLVNDFGDHVTEILEIPQPGKHVWPKVPLIVAVFAMFGCCCGIVVAIGGERNPNRMSQHDRSQKQYELANAS